MPIAIRRILILNVTLFHGFSSVLSCLIKLVAYLTFASEMMTPTVMTMTFNNTQLLSEIGHVQTLYEDPVTFLFVNDSAGH